MRHSAGLTVLVLICAILPATRASAQEADMGGIGRLYQEWGAATAARGAEGYAAFFVEDAVLLPPDGPAVFGRAAIRDWMQSMMDRYTSTTTGFRQEEMRVAHDWVFIRVSITTRRTPKGGGAAEEHEYKYLDVVSRQSDGSWRFVYRMWNRTGG